MKKILALIIFLSFSIHALAADFNVSGFWYDPALTGSGFNFAQIRGETHIYYYGYTKSGQRLWLISDGGRVLHRNEKQTYRMMEIKDGTFEKPTLNLKNWGTLDLTMTDCDTGSADLSGEDGAKQFSLTLLGKVDGTSCTGKIPFRLSLIHSGVAVAGDVYEIEISGGQSPYSFQSSNERIVSSANIETQGDNLIYIYIRSNAVDHETTVSIVITDKNGTQGEASFVVNPAP
jgi:hypothetical protein